MAPSSGRARQLDYRRRRAIDATERCTEIAAAGTDAALAADADATAADDDETDFNRTLMMSLTRTPVNRLAI